MASNNADLVRQHYATDENLRIRQETHDKYTIPKIAYSSWVLNTLQWHGNERVLDIGCGTGRYFDNLSQRFADIHYVGLDRSMGMLTAHRASSGLVNGDAMTLPFSDDYFDVVVAGHMLYHVENVDHTIQEIKRVLKPHGTLLVITNSAQYMPELQFLMRRAIILLTHYGAAQVEAPPPSSASFGLENGTRILSRHFYAVARHDLPSSLVFDKPEPALRYIQTIRDLREHALPEDVEWDDVVMLMRQQINQVIRHMGDFTISKLSGVLLATDQGGFIEPFYHQEQPQDEVTPLRES